MVASPLHLFCCSSLVVAPRRRQVMVKTLALKFETWCCCCPHCCKTCLEWKRKAHRRETPPMTCRETDDVVVVAQTAVVFDSPPLLPCSSSTTTAKWELAAPTSRRRCSLETLLVAPIRSISPIASVAAAVVDVLFHSDDKEQNVHLRCLLRADSLARYW